MECSILRWNFVSPPFVWKTAASACDARRWIGRESAERSLCLLNALADHTCGSWRDLLCSNERDETPIGTYAGSAFARRPTANGKSLRVGGGSRNAGSVYTVSLRRDRVPHPFRQGLLKALLEPCFRSPSVLSNGSFVQHTYTCHRSAEARPPPRPFHC